MNEEACSFVKGRTFTATWQLKENPRRRIALKRAHPFLNPEYKCRKPSKTSQHCFLHCQKKKKKKTRFAAFANQTQLWSDTADWLWIWSGLQEAAAFKCCVLTTVHYLTRRDDTDGVFTVELCDLITRYHSKKHMIQILKVMSSMWSRASQPLLKRTFSPLVLWMKFCKHSFFSWV